MHIWVLSFAERLWFKVFFCKDGGKIKFACIRTSGFPIKPFSTYWYELEGENIHTYILEGSLNQTMKVFLFYKQSSGGVLMEFTNVSWRETRPLCRGYWVWSTIIDMIMLLCSSMLLGVLSRELSNQLCPFCHPCIPPSPILQSKSQSSGQGLGTIIPLFVDFFCHFFRFHLFTWSNIDLILFSTLSKYGVHGFPTLMILNSTLRVHYQGSRTLGSLVTFYNVVTGMAFLLEPMCFCLFWVLLCRIFIVWSFYFCFCLFHWFFWQNAI